MSNTKSGKSTKRINKHEEIVDLLNTGPKTGKELEAVCKSYPARISEWNKVYKRIQIKHINGKYQYVRIGRILVGHKKAYPDYYVTPGTKGGQYQWPAKKRQLKKDADRKDREET